MSMINVLAVQVTASDQPAKPIKTKTDLRRFLSVSADLVTFVPVPVRSNPAHEAVRGIATFIPAGQTVTVHSPTNRKWTATVSRNTDHEFTVR